MGLGVITAASGGPLLFDQYAPFAILKPKNRKTETKQSLGWMTEGKWKRGN
jgi:hypothetical protein